MQNNDISRTLKAAATGALWLLTSLVSRCLDASSLGPSSPDKDREEDLDSGSAEQEGFIDLTDELAIAAADDQAGL